MNVLLFSPDTFGYHEKISLALKEKGHNVDWINHIYVKNNLDRIKFRLFPVFFSRFSEKYFTSQIDWSKNYDKVIVIKGEGLSVNLIQKLKINFKSADFIYYTWDSLSNVNGVESKLKYFDSIKSFDIKDCEKIARLTYLPLFYTKEYSDNSETITSETSDIKYSSVFIGTIHSDRFEQVHHIAQMVENRLKKDSFIFFYYPSKTIFKILKLFKKELKNVPIEKVSFTKLNANDISKIMKLSNIIIDYGHPDQTGLTMRTFESLGMNKKLITTNSLISNEDFYKDSNIFVSENKENNGLSEFIDLEYERIEPDIYNKYSVEEWLERLIKC